MVTVQKPKKTLTRRMKLGEILVRAGIISAEVLEEAIARVKGRRMRLGQVLMDMKAITDIHVAKAICLQLKLPFVRLDEAEIPPEIINLVPAKLAEKYHLVPFKRTESGLLVAMADPIERYAVDDLRFIIRMPIRIAVAPQSDIKTVLEKYYLNPNIEADLDYDLADDEDMEIIATQEPEEDSIEEIHNLAGLPPVVRFANAIIVEAINNGASDLHLEPTKTSLVIRNRIDGVMRETRKVDRQFHPPLVSRIKIVSNLDISIRRQPQDGKAQVKFGPKVYDLRVSTIPTSYGEKVTIRILDPRTAQLMPRDLGFSDQDLDNLLQAIKRPQGMVLVTGPTGSGKSSTLYACLNQLNSPTVNIITVEDPVEFDVNGINQVQINAKAGISFAAGLRSILRQDPDIVMVGEIRDGETARIAFQAAQTGHLVLSTLHTNDAPAAVTRLQDLEIDDFMISTSLVVVVGQRLVRKICPHCKVPAETPGQIIDRVQPYLAPGQKAQFWTGKGCERCSTSGYKGRLGVFEVFVLTPKLQRLIVPQVSSLTLRDAALEEGFQTLTMDGIKKALAGLTTIDEVFRVAPPEVAATSSADPQPAAEDQVADVVDTTPVTEAPPPAPAPPDPEVIAVGPFEENVNAIDGPDAYVVAGTTPTPDSAARILAGGALPTIVVADDDVVTRMKLGKALEANQFAVITASDGREALEIVRRIRPSLIVTDMDMPHLNGLQLLQELKAAPATRNIPVIMLTARDDDEVEVQGLDAGADDYITKPVHPKRFIARVKRFVLPPPRVLVVDDDLSIRKTLERYLSSNNYYPVLAADGEAAWQLIAQEPPDLIVTDHQMPGMDGPHLIRKLKSNPETCRIPIIMLTSRNDVEVEVAAFELGADDYLTKPVRGPKLAARVKRLLSRPPQTTCTTID